MCRRSGSCSAPVAGDRGGNHRPRPPRDKLPACHTLAGHPARDRNAELLATQIEKIEGQSHHGPFEAWALHFNKRLSRRAVTGRLSSGSPIVEQNHDESRTRLRLRKDMNGSRMREVYRFRKMCYLLDPYRELEDQTIYFASPHELNDPMEGLRDLVWSGDRIVWTNLFKNYIYCLHWVYFLFRISSDDSALKTSDVPVDGRWNEAFHRLRWNVF